MSELPPLGPRDKTEHTLPIIDDNRQHMPSYQHHARMPRKMARREEGFYLPAPLRNLIIVLLAAVLILSGVAITKEYLRVQEEKRLLEEEAALKARHPVYFKEIIEQFAQENNLNPALVYAVVLCESSFDEKAESRLGARGLMQLMEPTAQWAADKLDEENYTFDRMYEADTNVKFGTWYLSYLARRWNDGDAVKIVCAYHAGQGNVDAWLKNPEYSKDGKTLDVIPTDDTRKYARRVLSAYEVYQKYYYTPEPSAELPDGSNPTA